MDKVTSDLQAVAVCLGDILVSGATAEERLQNVLSYCSTYRTGAYAVVSRGVDSPSYRWNARATRCHVTASLIKECKAACIRKCHKPENGGTEVTGIRHHCRQVTKVTHRYTVGVRCFPPYCPPKGSKQPP